jgi:probable F420-dependent oxidoreductase
MEAWQNLGFTPHARLADLAGVAEEAGIVGVTLPEHLVTPTVIDTPNPYVPGGGAGYPPDTSFVDPWVTFGALSAVTERLRFLANVYVLPLRNLFVAAKAISTAAVLSRDRVSLGVGIGWLREEFDAVGACFDDRAARTDEMLQLLPALLRGEPVRSDGLHHHFAELRVLPAPNRPVPLLVGGMSTPALRRAARASGWVGVNHPEPELMVILDRLRRAREDAGDAERDFAVVVSRPADFDRPMARRYARAGVTAVVNRSSVFAVGADAANDAHRDAMAAFRDLVSG